MSLLNTEELKKQIANGTFTGLDDITSEFKNILKEVIQTASQEELTAHLGYDKHQESDKKNYRNGSYQQDIISLREFNKVIYRITAKAVEKT